MNILSGRLVIELVTQGESEDEESMIKNAHKGLSSELFEEIQLLLGASGYMVRSLGATLRKEDNPKQGYLNVIKSHVQQSKQDIHWLYNKSSRHKTKIE